MKSIKYNYIVKKYGLLNYRFILIGLFRLYDNKYYYNDGKLSLLLTKKEFNKLNLTKYIEKHIYEEINLHNYQHLKYIRKNVRLLKFLYKEHPIDFIKKSVNPNLNIIVRNIYNYQIDPLIKSIDKILLDYDKHKILILDKYYIKNRLITEMKQYPDLLKMVKYDIFK